jgi:hypothetical protein
MRATYTAPFIRVSDSGKGYDARDSVMRAMSTVPGILWTVQVRDVMQEIVS